MTRSSCKLALYSCGVRSAMHLSSLLGPWSAPTLSRCSQRLLYWNQSQEDRGLKWPYVRALGASVSAPEVLAYTRNMLRDQRGIRGLRRQLQVMLQIVQRGVQGPKLGL